MLVKDNANRVFNHGRLTLQACDVDENGNIENIDIRIDGVLKFCINIQRPALDPMSDVEALATIFDELTK